MIQKYFLPDLELKAQKWKTCILPFQTKIQNNNLQCSLVLYYDRLSVKIKVTWLLFLLLSFHFTFLGNKTFNLFALFWLVSCKIAFVFFCFIFLLTLDINAGLSDRVLWSPSFKNLVLASDEQITKQKLNRFKFCIVLQFVL